MEVEFGLRIIIQRDVSKTLLELSPAFKLTRNPTVLQKSSYQAPKLMIVT
jgi:hypothetical protein